MTNTIAYSTKIIYSKLIMNREYGTNSQNIFLNMCESFGWDKTQKDCFRWGNSLCAEYADTERKRDVWFISKPNYNLKLVHVQDNENKPIDTIIDDGDSIREQIPSSYCPNHNVERIVFARNANGKYVFMGIYHCDAGNYVRMWHRIATEYPL